MMICQTGEVRSTVDRKDIMDEPGDALSGRYIQLCVWTAQQCQRATDAIKKSDVAQVNSHLRRRGFKQHSW